jgi:hypothetical protein
MKQTAVEWFMDNIPTRFKNALLDMCKAEIEQAKEMEKEQIIDAHLNGQSVWDTGAYRKEVKKYAEQYYQETFNKQEQ